MTALNLLMAIIAWRLPDDHHGALGREPDEAQARAPVNRFVEWRVLLLSIALALISFGYGGLTSFSALFADALNVTPRSLFLTAMAASILIGAADDRAIARSASGIDACCCRVSSRRLQDCSFSRWRRGPGHSSPRRWSSAPASG